MTKKFRVSFDSVVFTGLLSAAIYSAFLVTTAKAIDSTELLNYKDGQSSVKVISESELDKVWGSNSPACMKDGAKLIGVNKAFKAKGLGYRDCSNSATKQRIHKAQGFNVTVFKLGQLPESVIKKIMGAKS